MAGVAPVLAVIVSLTSLARVQSACSTRHPADCDFGFAITCGWTLGSGWSVGSTDNYYYIVYGGRASGRVESGEACSTSNFYNCLNFLYWFPEDDVLDLNVMVNSSNTGERVVWTMSSANSLNFWQRAAVPVDINVDFTVIIEARTHSGHDSDKRVFVTDIDYVQRGCQLSPPAAAPKTTTQSPSTTTSTLSTSTTTATTVAPQPTTITSATSPPTSQPTKSTSSSEPMTSSASAGVSGQSRPGEVHTQSSSAPTSPVTVALAASPQPHDTIIIIIGAAAGFLAVVIIVVVSVVVMRRKQLLPGKGSLKDDPQRGEQAGATTSHNAAYNPDLEETADQGKEEGTAAGAPLDEVKSSQSSDDYYNVVETADQLYAAVHKPRTPAPGVLHTPHQPPTPVPSDQLYAVVNKHRTAHPGPPPTLTEPGDHSTCEITEECSASSANRPEEDLFFYEVPPGTTATSLDAFPRSMKKNSQLSKMSQDQDGDYNSLELGGRRRVVEREEGEGPGHVYSGLHEVDGDAYSEVNHHRRREVIDDHFSSFQ